VAKVNNSRRTGLSDFKSFASACFATRAWLNRSVYCNTLPVVSASLEGFGRNPVQNYSDCFAGFKRPLPPGSAPSVRCGGRRQRGSDARV
jgi:hypothetical protein